MSAWDRARRYAVLVRWPVVACLVSAVALVRNRRSIGIPRPLTFVVVALAPVAAAASLPRGRFRWAAIWATHMWAYKVAFELPYDEPARTRARLHVDYPIKADSALAAGMPPTARLQRRLRRPPRLSWLDRAATVVYFAWEVEPHAALLWILHRHRERFPPAALRLALTFDLTLIGYVAIPTAPPWWASEREGRMDRSVRRVVAEVGKELLGKPRPGVDHNAGANPWASMPSDHFASAAMTALVLGDVDPRAGALGWAYALLLGAVLVYSGEHYVIELAAGLALALTVRAAAPLLATPLGRAGAAIQRLAPS
jgi:membrane-associated phospholipid phosphatase